MGFIKINGKHINADTIKNYHYKNDEEVIVNFKNGSTITIKDESGDQYDIISGAYKVVQVVPCQKPIWAWLDKDNGKPWLERIFYLGLCADGVVRGVSFKHGFFEVYITGKNGFQGLYYDHQLSEVPGFENFDEKADVTDPNIIHLLF